MRFYLLLAALLLPVCVFAQEGAGNMPQEEMPPQEDTDTEPATDKPATANAEAVTKDEPPETAIEETYAVLQGLNKVTGHISRLEGKTGETLHFGNLDIVVYRCRKSSPDERPDNAALMEITELKHGEGPQRVFLGWMFSSSPGLSGLEHPVYDIGVLDCGKQDKTASEPAKAKAKKE